MKLVLIFRSKRLRYHSIENVFGSIQQELSQTTEVENVYVDKRGFKLSNLVELRKYVKRQNNDTVYHVTGDIHYAVFALPRKKSILTIHDCVFINNRKGLKGWVLKKLYLDWPVRYVSMVTAISEKTKKEVVSLTGCNPDKIRVINNPVSSLIRCTDKKFNADKPLLLFIGSLPNKNLNRVIEAIRGLPCTLNIIGSPDEMQQATMKNYNIDFVIERNLANEEMARRYENADIILFPSLYEGFGLPVIEGFKAGRAVLTSEISPLKELSNGGAWLVDPYSVQAIRSTLERIISDETTRNKKIQNGFEIVRSFSPDKVAASYQRAYVDLQLHKIAVLASLICCFQ